MDQLNVAPVPGGLIQLQPAVSTGAATPTGPVDLTVIYNAISAMAIDMKSQFAALSSQINDVKQETKSLKGNIAELDKGMAFLNKEITVMKSEIVPNI